MWLGIALARGEMVTVGVPRLLNSRFQDAMLADPSIINLNEKHNYYYEFGLKLVEYLDDKGIANFLITVFVERIKAILHRGLAVGDENSKFFARKLTTLERQIYEGLLCQASQSKLGKTKDEAPRLSMRNGDIEAFHKMHVLKKVKLSL
eukprot:TRINITY_DN10518_c0_g1_i1.p1 TRINITY_DN10518_c0_g1~~TRINITY_DN10518_c0_g1_i1.p1  ORF type:complete len:149 (+),score=36.03 TRINITY_DN10518_c0_g1_i1:216-662(+)